MEMRCENGLGLHVSIKHVNTLIKSLSLMRFIPMGMFYSYNSFSGHCSKCQINCEKGIKKRRNWQSELKPVFFFLPFFSLYSCDFGESV